MCTGTHDFIPVPETCRAEMVYLTPGGFAENVLHFRKDGGWDAGSLDTLGKDLRDNLFGSLDANVSDEISLVKIRLTDIQSEDGVGIDFTDGLPLPGSAAGGAAPQNVTMAITFATGFTGRSKRGRAYFIGLVKTAIDGDTVLTGVANAIRASYDLLLTPANVGGGTFVVVSYCHGGEWRDVGATTQVTSIGGDYTVDSQRRRLAGRGF